MKPPPAPLAVAALTYDAEPLAILGCSVRQVWRMQAAEHLPPAVRMGRLVRWPRAAIDRWLADGCPCRPNAATR